MRKKHNRPTTQPAAPAAKGTAKADDFVNFMSRLGLGAPNLQSATEYKPMQMLTQTWQVLVDMYCQSWIVGKIVGAIPEDMIRSGITITGDDDAGRVARIDAALSRLIRGGDPVAQMLDAFGGR